ncbi:tRNA uridine-5-carboxymethylaminomethyl(34) synthesis GTPase MnmE [Halieaceae bacterium IMCC8485]|uniref:tRNA modification GTPase MnmE n=1 Tax=Candidatus Seongchinamella marina TaxID=2518990 RepID=A0ABT3SWI7_9GAMM|nr:tRNA uridine-5-carboxymethylaminomethyl(34) synthesis GTPase MnmE [Candidatus Seongchinamella marina]MCX2973667.1 tRNA uridine-5-carboxymethylaminomethyl(34) synthesis GTPase MnmE [Candidatus Seongchinamella marina]
MITFNILDGDTIAAIATAPGRGGVGIVRLSGPGALVIGESISGLTLSPRHAYFSKFKNSDGNVLDSGIALYFPGPQSFTGEDVVELHGHGGPVVLDLLIKTCINYGARQARPGEFSERAYLNDKIDLTQAEAIADLINSTTEHAALNASRSLQGVFSQKIDDLVTSVTQLRVYVEAAIDFPEEEIDFIQDGQVNNQLSAIIAQLNAVMHQAKQGSLQQEGMKLVIAGKPNAGKSSLLNALSGQDTAIVTAIEGTTRDVLREHIQIDGMPLHIVDTAGLRNSADEVEKEGIRRAWNEIESADHILLVVDGSNPEQHSNDPSVIWPEFTEHFSRNIPVSVIRNKCDLSQHEPSATDSVNYCTIELSAKTGAGINLLKEHLKTCMGYRQGNETNFSARRRHLLSLEGAAKALTAGQHQLENAGAGELLAEDLRACQNLLGEITGAVSSDQLLGEIFSSFCIGK